MTVMHYGSLADAATRTELAKASEHPENWTIYLVNLKDRQRTIPQNKLYQVVLRKLAQQQGRSVQYWNDFLVERFLGFEDVQTEDGYTRKVLSSTASLTVTEFTEFLNACLTFSSDLQVH